MKSYGGFDGAAFDRWLTTTPEDRLKECRVCGELYEPGTEHECPPEEEEEE